MTAELVERRVRGSAVPRAELAEWRERFGLVAGITEKGDGPEPLSLALNSETGPAAWLVARFDSFRAAVRPQFSALQMGRQVHDATVVWHAGVAPGWHVMDDVDGHATAQAGLLLAVTVADCVPVYLADRHGRACALLHAGWRGVAGGILEAGLDVLCSGSKLSPSDVVMHCGVGICGSCYEVGEEVAQAVLGKSAGAGRCGLDLRAELANRASSLGMREVSISPLCTSCNRERFFSHRASGGAGGRQLAYLGRPAA